MSPLASMEGVFARVHLVRGKGERRKARLCIMSYVALLSGEGHTDAPSTASPFIRHYSIALNDAMPDGERQRLKLFAPRIVGTNDDQDAIRLRLTHDIFANEVIPRLSADLGTDWLPARLGRELADIGGDWSSPQALFGTFLNNASRATPGQQSAHIASLAAKLLATCATSAPADLDGSWYWSKAIDLLDRLCDTESEQTRQRVSAEQVAHATHILDQQKILAVIAVTISEVVRRNRHWLGARMTANRGSSVAPNNTAQSDAGGNAVDDWATASIMSTRRTSLDVCPSQTIASWKANRRQLASHRQWRGTCCTASSRDISEWSTDRSMCGKDRPGVRNCRSRSTES